MAIGKVTKEACADIVIDATDMYVTPGFINAHVHLGESIYAPFLQGRCTTSEYVNRTEELVSSISVIENRRQSIANYSALQLIKNGITTIGGGRTDGVSTSLGIRAVSGYMLMKSKKLGRFINNFKEKFKTQIKCQESSLLTHGLFVHSLNMVDKEILSLVREVFSEYFVCLMIHVSESSDLKSGALSLWGKSELGILKQFSLLNERTLLIHGNHFSEEDLVVIQNAGSSIIHCLSSNMATADKTLDLKMALERKINVAIATDGAITSGDFSVLREAGNAYRYHNRFENKLIIPAGVFLDMITINAAQALGLKKIVGSIEVGKQADIVILKPPFEEPKLNPIERLISYAGLAEVCEVIVAGKILFQDPKPINPKSQQIEADFKKTISEIIVE